MNVEQFTRKSFPVDAVRVTSANMEEVSGWCDGEVRTEEESGKVVSYIKVRVHNPLNERQTKAYSGDWVLYAGKGYKVYKDSAFRKSFDEIIDKPQSANPAADEFAQNVFQEPQEPIGMAPTPITPVPNPGGTHVVGQ